MSKFICFYSIFLFFSSAAMDTHFNFIPLISSQDERIQVDEKIAQLREKLEPTIQIYQEGLKDFVYNKTHPWDDSSNTVFFGLSPLNQVKKFGDKPFSKKELAPFQELINKAGKQHILICEMNESTQSRNPNDSAISTMSGIWINPNKYNTMNNDQRMQMLAYHFSLSHSHKLLINNIEWTLKSSAIGGAAWATNRCLKKVKNPLVPVVITTVCFLKACNASGLTKDIIKVSSFNGDMPVFTSQEIEEADQKAQHLLQS